MKRHYNFTDRVKINHADVVVEFDPASSAFRLKLPQDLVTDASTQSLFVEVDSSGSPHLTRHKLTWTEAGVSEEWCDLGGVPASKARFTIKVVETNGDGIGRILKLARHVRPTGKRPPGHGFLGREGLIQIQRETMVEQIWRLEFGDEPVLVLNQELTMSDEDLTKHPVFRALVYPEVCRRCLEWAVYEMDIDPSKGLPEPDSADKASLWVRFALTPSPGDPPPRPSDGWAFDNRGEMNAWIEQVVTRVSGKHLFLTAMGTGKQEAIK